jgi:hypothetical protein
VSHVRSSTVRKAAATNIVAHVSQYGVPATWLKNAATSSRYANPITANASRR